MPRVPNFCIAGAPKSGTTSLYRYLGQHPRIYMSPIKEPNFFAAEIREDNCDGEVRRNLARQNRDKRFGEIVADWEDYLRLFANAGQESAMGEASVSYLWSPTAPVRISEKIPDAKIVVMLRNPADRAFSQYLHGVGIGAIRWSFREHIGRNLRRRSAVLSVDYPFLEFGLYGEQLIRYRHRFGANVWIGLHEDFVERPAETLSQLCQFLGVDSEFAFRMGVREMQPQVPRTAATVWLKRTGCWQAAARITPPKLRPLIRRTLVHRPGRMRMDPADRNYLAGFYRDDVRRLAGLLNRDLSGWM